MHPLPVLSQQPRPDPRAGVKVGQDVGSQEIERHSDGGRRLVGDLLERRRPGHERGKLPSRRDLLRPQQRTHQLRRIGQRRGLDQGRAHRSGDGMTIGAKRLAFDRGDAARRPSCSDNPTGFNGQPRVLIGLAHGEGGAHRNTGQTPQRFVQTSIRADGQSHGQHAGYLGIDGLVFEIHPSKIDFSWHVVNGRKNQSAGLLQKCFA
jgi:hypothetical protein